MLSLAVGTSNNTKQAHLTSAHVCCALFPCGRSLSEGVSGSWPSIWWKNCGSQELSYLRMQPKVDGRPHLRLSTSMIPIAKKTMQGRPRPRFPHAPACSPGLGLTCPSSRAWADAREPHAPGNRTILSRP